MRLGHVPVLDAIRGVAILLVLAVHARHLPGGALGVDLFFVLSGFLITTLLLAEWKETGRISLREFFRRRALRLLPALAVVLIVVTGALALTAEDFQGQLAWVGFSFGYVVNLASVVNGYIAAPSLQHMWSLSQEEQFYVLWPVALLIALRRRASPHALVALLAAVALTLVIYRAFLGLAHASPGQILYSPESRSIGLVLGCLAGVAFSHGLVRRVPLWLATTMLVPAVLSVALLDLEGRWSVVICVPLFCVAATVVLLVSVLEPRWWFARMVDRRLLRDLGRISYGVYLWHWPLFFAFGWVVGLPLTLLVAALSYRFVEVPFLRRRHNPGHSSDRPRRPFPLPLPANRRRLPNPSQFPALGLVPRRVAPAVYARRRPVSLVRPGTGGVPARELGETAPAA